MTSIIEHDIPCQDRLLGYAARHMPRHATFNIRNLNAAAGHIRDAGKAPVCECGRRQLSALNDKIHAARRAGEPVTVLDSLVRQRTALHSEMVGQAAEVPG